jgi:hypothetical protein
MRLTGVARLEPNVVMLAGCCSNTALLLALSGEGPAQLYDWAIPCAHNNTTQVEWSSGVVRWLTGFGSLIGPI